MFKRILLCHEDSDAGREAVKRCAEIGKLFGASVYVLSVVPTGISDPLLFTSVTGHACLVPDPLSVQATRDSVKWLTSRGVAARGFVTRGDSVSEIVKHTKQFAIDLVVLSSYPKRAARVWWSGARRKSLSELVRCSVLVAANAKKAL